MRFPITLVCLMVLFATSLWADDKSEGPERWEADIQKFEAEDARVRRRPNPTLFIGSSSIRKWDLNQSFPGANMINRGFGGSEIADSIHFADRIVFPYRPVKIVLYAGDNDISRGKTAAQVVKDFGTFTKRVHAKLPETKMIFIAIKPSIKRWALVSQMRDANRQIQAICEQHDWLAFADIDKPMIGNDGQPKPKLFVKDGLHLSPAGYAVWKKVLAPHLR